MNMNDVLKYCYNVIRRDGKSWRPFISYFYLTYDCNFRCSYCSDGYENPYYKHAPEGDLPAEKAVEIMRILNQTVNYAIITGGEPLKYKHYDYFIRETARLKFKRLALTTNGYYLDKYLEPTLSAVDNLIISVDTMNPQKANSIFGTGDGTFERVIENIKMATEANKNKKCLITISSVTTPDNIDDQYEVCEFAHSIGAQFTTSPQLVGVKPNPGLIGNEKYLELFNYLISKRKKADIFGSKKYLEAMRDLKKFTCYPFAMLGISPLGEIFYPCPEIGTKTSNILDIKDLKEAKSEGKRLHGRIPDCDNRCHSCCALIFSLMLDWKMGVF